MYDALGIRHQKWWSRWSIFIWLVIEGLQLLLPLGPSGPRMARPLRRVPILKERWSPSGCLTTTRECWSRRVRALLVLYHDNPRVVPERDSCCRVVSRQSDRSVRLSRDNLTPSYACCFITTRQVTWFRPLHLPAMECSSLVDHHDYSCT